MESVPRLWEFLVCEIVGSILDVAIGQLRQIVVARHWLYRRAQRRHSDLKRLAPPVSGSQDRVDFRERLEDTRQERDRVRRRYRDILAPYKYFRAFQNERWGLDRAARWPALPPVARRGYHAPPGPG